jgi:hypothetical protein
MKTISFSLTENKKLLNRVLVLLTDSVVFAPHILIWTYQRYQRYRTKKAEAHAPILQPVPTMESLGILNTNPNEIGVGVYQEEILALGQLETSQVHLYRVLGTLRIENLPHIQKDTVRNLFQTAYLVLHYLQFCPLMQDSQNSTETRLLRHCPHAKEPIHGIHAPSKEDNTFSSLAKELLQRLLELNSQEFHIGQCLSTCPYSTAKNSGGQPNGNDTNLPSEFVSTDLPKMLQIFNNFRSRFITSS